MLENESSGNADRNGYFNILCRRYLQPLTDLIDTNRVKTVGKGATHYKLFSNVPSDALAFLLLKNITIIYSITPAPLATSIFMDIARDVYIENYAADFEKINPKLFSMMVDSFNMKMSRDEKHKYNALRNQASKAGIEIRAWSNQERAVVGSCLLSFLEEMGLVKTSLLSHNMTHRLTVVNVTDEIVKLIESCKSATLEFQSLEGAMLVPPKDWTNLYDGGYLTRLAQSSSGRAVKTKLPSIHDGLLGELTVLPRINALQRTGWVVDEEMLNIIKRAGASKLIKPLDIPDEIYKPLPPESFDDPDDPDLKEWKRAMGRFYDEERRRKGKLVGLSGAIREASSLLGYTFYFPYFADFRYRLYPRAGYLSPQGNDVSKSLLKFSEGKKITNREEYNWFIFAGAKLCDVDLLWDSKGILDDDVVDRWIEENERFIYQVREEVCFTGWALNGGTWQMADGDCELQFISWCLDYCRYKENPSEFLCRQVISFDGKCNGFQHLSAMLLDEVGGSHVGLTPKPDGTPPDIYKAVSDRATEYYPKISEVSKSVIDVLELHRDMVKQPVMTTPYGVTNRTKKDFLFGKGMGISSESFTDRHKAIGEVVDVCIDPAIKDVVEKAVVALEWLQKNAMVISSKSKDGIISWYNGSGCKIVQYEPKMDFIRVTTHLSGKLRLRLGIVSDKSDNSKHKSGLAPNLTHSNDAAHLHLVVDEMEKITSNLRCCHDDVGTDITKASHLYRVLRTTFVELYKSFDILQNLADNYDLKDVPEKGNLNIENVLKSKTFFS